MKKIFLAIIYFSALPIAYAGCVPEEVFAQKSLRDVYFSLRALHEKGACKISSQEFLLYGERAMLSARYAEALWAAEQGMLSDKKNNYELKIIKGRALLNLGRLEEALQEFLPITKNEALYKRNDTRVIFSQAYLLLIQTYYLKANKQVDKNVNYLVSLFQNRYKEATAEQEILLQWLEKNKK